MTAEEAAALVVKRDGSVYHAGDANLSSAEATALVLKARGARDYDLAAALAVTVQCARGILHSGAKKLATWHLQTAKEVLATFDNKPVREPRLFENMHGEEEELRLSATSEDSSLRIHPDLKPTPYELTAPQRSALSVILQ